MSAEQVRAFLKLLEDANFRAAFEAAAPEAKRELLTQAGLDIPVEEAEAALKGERELAEQELDKVAGGLNLQGLNLEGLRPEGLRLDGLRPEGLSPDGLSPDGLSPEGPRPRRPQPGRS